jgi:hypothetical protein
MSTARFGLLLVAVAGAGCYQVKAPVEGGLSTFEVEVTGVYLPGSRTPLPVVTACSARHGGEDKVPAAERGTADCRYAIPRGEVEIELTASALDDQGQLMPDFNGPVAFRSVPGDLTGDYGFRWGQALEGVAKGKIKVAHLYSEVRVWAEDAPPRPIYADGGVGGDLNALPKEPAQRSFATGLSAPLMFEETTLAKMQIPDGADNTKSPLVGQFITVGRNPESGDVLRQSCAEDPSNDRQESRMVITGTDPTGFFVTDLTACRLKEKQGEARTPEPNGFVPGTYGSMFVYNYAFPEGLDQGDLIWSLSGSVQEFTSTTQLTFPSWTLRERVREGRDPAQWNRHLDKILGGKCTTDADCLYRCDSQVKQCQPHEVHHRMCALDNRPAPFVTDVTCGQNKSSLKVESLESALVMMKRVRFPQVFVNCDLNGDSSVPQICERPATRTWEFCGNAEDPAETPERICAVNCITSQGEYANKICTERNTFTSFGQYNVEINPLGPAEAGLDESLPGRIRTVEVGAASVVSEGGTAVSAATQSVIESSLFCQGPVRYKLGDGAVVAGAEDTLVPAKTLVWLSFAQASHVALIAAEGPTRCALTQKTHTRVNLVTKDAVPDLVVDCREDDPDAARAADCKNLREASFDVIGHLRQVQAARPRWNVLPRDADDLCCHPGPSGQCPRPIKACKN